MSTDAAIGLLLPVLMAGSPFPFSLGADPNSDTAGGVAYSFMSITVAAPILIVLPKGSLIVGIVKPRVTTIWAIIFAAISLVGIVLAIIIGLTTPAKNVALHGNAS